MTIRTIDYQSQSSSLKETHNAASLLLHGKCVQVCISSLPPVPDCITTHSNLFFWWFVNQHGCLQSSWLVFFNVFYLCVYLLFLPFLFSFFFFFVCEVNDTFLRLLLGFFCFFSYKALLSNRNLSLFLSPASLPLSDPPSPSNHQLQGIPGRLKKILPVNNAEEKSNSSISLFLFQTLKTINK